MTGDEYKKWVENAEKLHYGLMKDAGFLAKTNCLAWRSAAALRFFFQIESSADHAG